MGKERKSVPEYPYCNVVIIEALLTSDTLPSSPCRLVTVTQCQLPYMFLAASTFVIRWRSGVSG